MDKGLPLDGEKLRRLRRRKALSLRTLGEMAGVSYETVQRLETTDRPAMPSTVRKLADALGVEPEKLMKKDEL